MSSSLKSPDVGFSGLMRDTDICASKDIFISVLLGCECLINHHVGDVD